MPHESGRATVKSPAEGLAVVTDSTHYLPPDVLKSAGVEQVSLYVGLGEHRYGDSNPGFRTENPAS